MNNLVRKFPITAPNADSPTPWVDEAAADYLIQGGASCSAPRSALEGGKMLRSVISKIGAYRRIAVLASACVLATAGTLALIGTANAADTPSCSNATLKGNYIFGTIAWVISGGTPAPLARGGFVFYNGAGTGTFVNTANLNGVVVGSNARGTLTNTINADCTGTIVYNLAERLIHANVYVSPSGKLISVVETDPGSVFAGIGTRVSE